MMKKTICIVLTLVMSFSAMITVSPKEEKEFKYSIGNSDILIPAAENQADTLNKIGLFKGTDKGYELESPVTRAEAVTMALRMVGEEASVDSSSEIRFEDVNKEHWAFYLIGYAAGKGYINGTSDKTFEPDRGVTGREFVKILLTAAGYQGITIQDAYEAGIKYALLVNNYTKLAVSTDDYKLIRNDVVNICYSSLLVKAPDGMFLKDILIEKGIVDEQILNSLFYMECSTGQSENFAWNLNEYMPTDKNYMFSPLSVKMALAMAAAGADGETKAEILKTLGIEDLAEFNEFSAKLINEYSKNKNVQLNIANSLWLNTDYNQNVDFEKSFKDIIKNYYKGDSEKVNSKNAVETVNRWVRNKTNDKITGLIEDGDFLACILNAIYFKGEWAEKFNKEDTEKAEFTDRNGKKTEIDFMNMTDYFDYYEDDCVQMVKLPYNDEKTSMYIAISAERAVDLDKNIEKMESRTVQISLPKFKTEFDIELADTLSQMGIKTAFDPDKADFKNMFTGTPDNIFISDIIHKTFINIGENETEAAAVTGVLLLPTACAPDEPIVFCADKPFTYFIRDDVNGEILFMGEYAFAS